jgi:hypothetical protein
MNKVTVYTYIGYDITTDETHCGKSRAIRKFIDSIPSVTLVEGSDEEIDASLLDDEGRVRNEDASLLDDEGRVRNERALS